MATILPLAARIFQPTSREAAKELRESGTQKRQAVLFARLVWLRPGMTTHELAMLSPTNNQLLRYQFARRASDAERLGWIRRGIPRKCGVTMRSAFTWFPVIHPISGEMHPTTVSETGVAL